ncbi:MAG: hypothetical protein M0Z60_14725 [Nitrospiraceae bacterium]|nr:hypothetical protein [Nitrospiraceae bacterium]
MRSASFVLPLLSFWTLVLLLSCSQKISDDEAKKMVLRAVPYPQPVFNMTHAGNAGNPDIPRFIQGVEKLAAEGYIKEDAAAGGDAKNRTYVPTEKSEGLLTGVYVRDSFVMYDGAVCNEVFRKIEEVDFDKDTSVATIRYVTGYERIEPFYSLLCLNEYCECFGEKLKRKEARTLKVRKVGNDWKPAS